MKLTESISSKVLGAVLLATVVLMGMWGVYGYVGQKRTQILQLQTNASLIAERLANSLIYPVWNLNHDEVDKTIAYEMQAPDVQAIILEKDNGEFYTGKIKGDDDKVVPLHPAAESNLPTYPRTFLTLRKPIVKFNVTIGFVSLHVTDQQLREKLFNIATQILLEILVMSAVISSIIFFSLRRLIIQPLTLLEKSVRGISTDNMTVEVQARGDDEIAKLAGSFRTMAKELNFSFSKQELLLKELKERDERFSSIVSNVPGAIYRIWPTDLHEVQYISESIRDISGYPVCDFINNRCGLRDLVAEADRRMVLDSIKNAIESRKPYDINYRIVDASGTLRWVHETGQALFDANGMVQWLDGLIIDTTDIHSKDEQLRQSQKMETIGMLAGGIAHDFNNILTCVFGTTSLLRMRLDMSENISRDDLEQDVSTIELAAGRATELVRQILTLSMNQEIDLLPTDLNLTLKHIYKLCRSSFDKTVEISMDYADGVADVLADPIQIEQLLLNVCVNAAHAMTIMRPEGDRWGGTLKIALRRVTADRFFCMTHPDAEERGYWVATVEDTGVGMNKETLAQIFNPFFSTKETGKGTGLGLSMVYSIVRKHQGFISVYSEPGLGTTFHVFLPLAEPSPHVDTDQSEVRILPQGSGAILVVDDEDMIRSNAAQILKGCGYTVILAENGEVAVELYRQHAANVCLVLLDMVMPNMSGQEVFCSIREISKEAPVLLSSGFKQDFRMSEILEDASVDFIHKPYTLFGLARKVHEMVSGKTGLS